MRKSTGTSIKAFLNGTAKPFQGGVVLTNSVWELVLEGDYFLRCKVDAILLCLQGKTIPRLLRAGRVAIKGRLLEARRSDGGAIAAGSALPPTYSNV